MYQPCVAQLTAFPSPHQSQGSIHSGKPAAAISGVAFTPPSSLTSHQLSQISASSLSGTVDAQLAPCPTRRVRRPARFSCSDALPHRVVDELDHLFGCWASDRFVFALWHDRHSNWRFSDEADGPMMWSTSSLQGVEAIGQDNFARLENRTTVVVWSVWRSLEMCHIAIDPPRCALRQPF